MEIIDTPNGERMRLTVTRQLRATVTIDRGGGKVETLVLTPISGSHHAFMSAAAPAEPHEFDAQLRLEAGDQEDVLPFRMVEPEGHSH